MTRTTLLVAAIGVAVAAQQSAQAAQSVFVDFIADTHNGAGGGPNGTADWIDNLNVATTGAGVAAFTPAERTQIENGILSQLGTMYSPFNVSFFTTDPGGSRERINFGAFDATPGSLGIAPLDIHNLGQYAGDEPSSTRVFTNNFAFIVESGDVRAQQINELSTALAGTGGHEFGHAVGAQHHHAYGVPGITPANYANTGGLQNNQIMATGSTGLSETGRETLRSFGQWERLQLEAAGGGNTTVRGAGNGGRSLATVVLQESDSFTGADVGGTVGTAKPLALSTMPVSGLLAHDTLSTMSSNADVDVYSFTIPSAGRILADVWTTNAYFDAFDSVLTLIGTDGTTVLAQVDDTRYNGDVFAGASTVQSLDSSLLNITLPTAGTYFLRVSSLSNQGGADGGIYNLIFGVAVPEPGTLALLALAVPLALARRRRARRA